MSTLVYFVEDIAIGLYIFIGIGFFLAFRQWAMAGRAFRSTHFELERSFARERRSGAFFMMALYVELILLVIGVQNVVAPTMHEDQAVLSAIASVNQGYLIQPADDGDFATSTPPAVVQPPVIDASGVELSANDEALIFVTPTLTHTPVGTIEPNAPPVQGCNTPNATLQIPANGMRVFQQIPVRGVAYAEDFSKFTLELRGPETLNQFVVVTSDPIPATELTTLAQFDPAAYTEGAYDFRLMVFDTQDVLVASCQVTIYISPPIPTITPIPTRSG